MRTLTLIQIFWYMLDRGLYFYFQQSINKMIQILFLISSEDIEITFWQGSTDRTLLELTMN